MSKGKVTDKDGISVEILKAGGITMYKAIAQRFSHYLRSSKIPSVWKESNTILLHKKGDTEDLKNYRPICLLGHLYKLFTRIIYNRLNRTLDEQQPKGQAGFRGEHSTMDHIFVLNQMIERARELPLCLVFVDFEKAFDNVEINAVLNGLKSQGVKVSYIKILVEANSGYTTDINVFCSPITIPIAKGVRQGDTISPKLFAACLESVFRKISWRGGVNIDGEVLTHLRFAYDIVILANDTQTAQEMLLQSNEESKAVGLKLSISKTKHMRSDERTHASIQLNGEAVEEVNSFTYLGQVLDMHHKTNEEISRRCMAGWRAFNSIKEVLEKLSKPEDRALLFNSTVVPSMLYGSET
ncbi:hypothetical protein AB6A40_011627, partial [Gnathostoma spinigerum]